MRGIQVFLDNVGAVSMYSVRKGLADAGAKGANRIAIFEQLMDSQTLVVTANTSTLYAYTYTDLAHDGPTVIEVPPGMLGFLDDAWQRFVGNMGVTGPDKGKGGKYLVLPPGYAGEIPDGYFLLKPPTNRNFLFLRGSIKNGLKPAVENITSKLKVYPLKDAANRRRPNSSTCRARPSTPSSRAISATLKTSTRSSRKNPSTPSAPKCAVRSPPSASSRASPSPPMTRMKKLLTEAATLGNATSRAITYHPRFAGVKIYPDDPKSVWSTAFANKNTSFEADGTMGLDARVLYYFNAGGVTPAMATTPRAQARIMLWRYSMPTNRRSTAPRPTSCICPRMYRSTISGRSRSTTPRPAHSFRPARTFPTVGSQTEGIKKNADGSYDLYFAPKAPEGKEGNWLQTVPGKSWFTILRMYGPLEPWIDKTWRPGEIELVQ